MSNIVQRIFSNAVLFALLMSVSLTLHASNTDVNLDNAKLSNHFITCDIPDQANLDLTWTLTLTLLPLGRLNHFLMS